MNLREDFNSEDEFLQYIKQNCNALRGLFRNTSREQIKDPLNQFFTFYLIRTKDNPKLHWQVYMEYIDLLNFYAQEYNNRETLENILRELESERVKQGLFTMFPVRSKLVVSVTLVAYFFLIREEATDQEIRTKEFIEPILKAKTYLTKIYSKYLADKSLLNDGQLLRCCESLGFCYGALSRWFESLFYLNKAESIELNNPNVHFTRALVLERVQLNTCSDYSDLLLLDIIDSAKKIYNSSFYQKVTADSFRKMATERRKLLRENNTSLTDLRKHRLRATKGVEKYSKYEKFCLENQLFLSEHSQYCNCKRATYDNIKIKSGHKHTHIDYLKPFEKMLEGVVFDFVLARLNYYDSLSMDKVSRLALRSLKRKDHKRSLKLALLKDSFRLCYSIFDTISISILEALEVDYKTIRNENGNRQQVHFTNIWDDLITQTHFDENYYVQTLYSIAYDVKDKSGHKEFRDIRNAMEHKLFHIKGSEHQSMKGTFNRDSFYEISEEELYEKTLLLLIYTKSLIMTYVYFLRRVSVRKDPEMDVQLH